MKLELLLEVRKELKKSMERPKILEMFGINPYEYKRDQQIKKKKVKKEDRKLRNEIKRCPKKQIRTRLKISHQLRKENENFIQSNGFGGMMCEVTMMHGELISNLNRFASKVSIYTNKHRHRKIKKY